MQWGSLPRLSGKACVVSDLFEQGLYALEATILQSRASCILWSLQVISGDHRDTWSQAPTALQGLGSEHGCPALAECQASQEPTKPWQAMLFGDWGFESSRLKEANAGGEAALFRPLFILLEAKEVEETPATGA